MWVYSVHIIGQVVTTTGRFKIENMGISDSFQPYCRRYYSVGLAYTSGETEVSLELYCIVLKSIHCPSAKHSSLSG